MEYHMTLERENVNGQVTSIPVIVRYTIDEPQDFNGWSVSITIDDILDRKGESIDLTEEEEKWMDENLTENIWAELKDD